MRGRPWIESAFFLQGLYFLWVLATNAGMYGLFIALWVFGAGTWSWRHEMRGSVLRIEPHRYLFGGRYGVYRGTLYTLRLITDEGEQHVVVSGRDMKRFHPLIGSVVCLEHHRFQRDFPWNRIVAVEPVLPSGERRTPSGGR